MSLIQTILTDDYAIMAADNSIGTGLIKINENLLIGISGRIEDNLRLFSDYFDYIEKEGFVWKEGLPDVIYQDLIDNLTPKFQEMLEKKYLSDEPVPYEINSIVCGYTEQGYELSQFNTDKGIIRIKKLAGIPYELVSAGKKQYHNFLDEKLRNIYIWNGEICKDEYMQSIQETFMNAAFIDNEINADCQIEII